MSGKVYKSFVLSNLLSNSGLKLIELYFDAQPEIEVISVRLGHVRLSYHPEKTNQASVEKHLRDLGFYVVTDPDVTVTEQIKAAAVELIVLGNNTNSLVRNSDYISDKLQMPYSRLSKIFSTVTGSTIEKYLIQLKIEKVKDLLLRDEFTLSEIAYQLDYSSVQYLSSQFKSVVGVTVGEYRKNPDLYRVALEQLV